MRSAAAMLRNPDNAGSSHSRAECLSVSNVTAYDSRGNFVALDAATYPRQAAGLVSAMLERGILVRRMTDTIVRISVGNSSETDAVLRALDAG